MKKNILFLLSNLFIVLILNVNSNNCQTVPDSLSKSVSIIVSNQDSLKKSFHHLQKANNTVIQQQKEIVKELKNTNTYFDLLVNFIISIPSGIIAGIFASIVWLLITNRNHKRKLRKICEPLVGNYKVLNIGDESIVSGAQITIRYISENILETIGSSQDYGEWRGRIVIDEHSPDWGSGFYRYNKTGPQGNENGLHRVIIDRENDRLYVNIETFTHDIQKTKAMIWQKIE